MATAPSRLLHPVRFLCRFEMIKPPTCMQEDRGVKKDPYDLMIIDE